MKAFLSFSSLLSLSESTNPYVTQFTVTTHIRASHHGSNSYLKYLRNKELNPTSAYIIISEFEAASHLS